MSGKFSVLPARHLFYEFFKTILSNGFLSFNIFYYILLLLVLLNISGKCYAVSYDCISDNPKIHKALNVLEKTKSYETLNTLNGDNFSKKPIKIMFYSLVCISPSYCDAYALATSDDSGNMYILIDYQYQNDPPEAIASLIAHEATHKLKKTTMEEEIQAWTNEVLQWVNTKKISPDLAKLNENESRLVKRLNNLEKIYKASNDFSSGLVNLVMNNSSYRMLSLN